MDSQDTLGTAQRPAGDTRCGVGGYIKLCRCLCDPYGWRFHCPGAPWRRAPAWISRPAVAGRVRAAAEEVLRRAARRLC